MDEMEKIEKVEKLSAKAGVSLEDARAALERNQWDMLDALIDLDKQGKSSAGATYSTEAPKMQTEEQQDDSSRRKSGGFGELLGKVTRWCIELIKKGMDNFIVIERRNMKSIEVPITVFIILLFVTNWLLITLLVVGLFFGFRYSFQGADISHKGVDDVNDVLGNMGKKASGFTDHIKDGYNNNETDK